MAELAPLTTVDPDAATGLAALPRVPWGTHLCQLYRGAEELEALLVPFFAAGLQAEERCVWITGDPLRAGAARAALAAAVPDLEARIRRGQLEVLDHERWYAAGDGEQVLQAWLAAEARALRDGYRGLRINGNIAWLPDAQWQAFQAYERRVHQAFHGRRIVALCSYPLTACTTDQVLDVVRHHGLALARRGGSWQVIRSATEALAVAAAGPDAHGDHQALLYAEDDFPAARVAAFAGEGLRGGEAVVMVLGGDRARRVREELVAGGLDPRPFLAEGQLVWLDPEETLPALLRDGAVDAQWFGALVPPLLERLRGRFGKVRVQGEMVDLLARRGDFAGALALERLWNALLRDQPAPVLCTYGAAALAGEQAPARLEALEAEHGHLAAASDLRAFVSALAEKTVALEAAEQRRLEAERERDRWRQASRAAASHLAGLQRVTAALLAARSAADLGAVVVGTMAEATGAQGVLLAAAGPGGELQLLAHAGGPEAVGPVPGLFALGPDAPLAEVFQGGQPVILASPEAMATRWPGAAGRSLAAWAALPLVAGGARRGVLAFGWTRPASFSPADRALLDDLARQAASALERVQLLADLEQARARAEAASQAKDEFLAMLGHELRNPLSPMFNVLQLLERRAPDAFRRERGILQRQLRHLARLVDDLLDVSRIVRGQLALRPERVELGRVVADAVEAAAPLLEARRHRLRVQAPERGLPVHGDPHRLVQAVTNLLTNAARYTPEGGQVEVVAEARGGAAVVRVADDGQGLDPALAPRVFDLFVQGPRDLARSEGGLGLGLAIVRSVVERHGGQVRAESPGPGRGSTFELTLPLLPPEPAAAPAPGRQATAAGAGARVLVVDDNEDAAETLADLLRCAGHEVRTAHRPEDALALAAAFRPRVALIDLGLPGLDGWALGARLRAEAGDGAPSCVAVSGYGLESDRARSREAGFAGHLVKPVDPDRLLGLVEALAGGGR